MTNTTWNPLDKSGTTTLSGSNLIASSVSGLQVGARAVDSQTTGKFYFECTAGAWNVGCGAGIATGSAVFTTAAPAGAALVQWGNGVITVNGSTAGLPTLGFSSVSASSIIGIAADLTNGLIWFRVAPSGNWNGNATYNPATGVGGVSLAAIAGGGAALYPWTSFSSASTTANFGGSAFSGAVPSGFTAGWLTAAPPAVDLAGNLGGPSYYGKLSYGLKKYSRIPAFAPIFSADVTVTPALNLSGDLAPVIVFAADLDVHVSLIELGGDIAPQIALEGALSLDLPLTVLEGGLTPIVVLGASGFVSGPLWAESEPCPSPPWAESEPCPPSMWTPIGPCDPVEWEKTEKCNG